MKYLLIIFSLYMTLLTLMPCQDREESSIGDVGISAFQRPSADTAHFSQDACPPFCTCACCSVFRHFPVVNDHIEIIENSSIPYTSYRMPAIAELSIEIYQPPRIV